MEEIGDNVQRRRREESGEMIGKREGRKMRKVELVKGRRLEEGGKVVVLVQLLYTVDVSEGKCASNFIVGKILGKQPPTNSRPMLACMGTDRKTMILRI